MPTFHIDPIAGNDANTGLSWAQAWKTFTSGATAARIAPGDDIKVAKTAAPVSIGSATWTNEKIGNSVTFATAPTKLIDAGKAGWVTMGAGSVVTNAQTTAYMTPVTFGGTTVGALRWVTTASANGALKDLGSTLDFSDCTQISFWLRSTAAFDCTGAQDMVIELCSDAAATVVVSSRTIPKWNYAANTWYPIVISGAALSTTVRSVRFRTASNTSQTFYVDEIFASPTGGLNLRSLIGFNDGNWYPIRCIRGADVCLLSGFAASDAIGCQGTNQMHLDAGWFGTTQTSTTWMLQPSIETLPTTGPTASTWAINNLEAASNALPRRISGGWDTTLDVQNGETWYDGVAQQHALVNAQSNAYLLIEDFGFVRYNTLFNGSYSNILFNDCSFISFSNGFNIGLDYEIGWLRTLGFTGANYKCLNGNGSITVYPQRIGTTTCGEAWGVGGVAFGNAFTVANLANFPLPGVVIASNVIYAGGNSFTALSASASGVTLSLGTVKHVNTAFTATRTGNLVAGIGSRIKADTIDLLLASSSSNAGSIFATNLVLAGTGTNALISTDAVGGVYGAVNWSLSAPITNASSTGLRVGSKVFFHNWLGGAGDFRVYVSDAKNNTPSYFELQSADVYTAGSKAVRFQGLAYVATDRIIGAQLDLKLASAAAEANKLVTVTARVKRNSANVNAGIFIPAIDGFLPGISIDVVSSSITSVGAWDLVTVTFTPTQDCVFDVLAYLTITAAATPVVTWDALTITQAA